MLAIDQIKKKQLSNLSAITVLTGSDIGQYQTLKENFLKQIHFNPTDLNYSYFDLSNCDFNDVILDLESLSFFGDDKIVIIDQFLDITTERKSFLDETALKHFEEYLNNPLESTHLVIFAPGSLDGKRRLVKLLKRDAEIFEAKALSTQEYDQYFKAYMTSLDLNCDTKTFEYLKEKSNAHYSDTQKNIALLKSVLGKGVFTKTDIDDIIPKTLQDNIFDLSTYLLNGHLDKVNALVYDLRLQKQDEIQFIAYLLSRFRLMLQLRLVTEEVQVVSSIETELSHFTGLKSNPYYVKRTLAEARKYPISFIKKVIELLIACDYDIKTGKYDKDYLFDILILQIMSEQNKALKS